MKTAKLVLGIISIVYSVVVFFQTFYYSTVKNIGNAILSLVNQNAFPNLINIMISAGYLAAALMLAAGITSIVARKSYGGAVACTFLYALSGVVAYSGLVGYLVPYRLIPSIYCLVLTLFFGVSMFAQRYDTHKPDIDEVTP